MDTLQFLLICVALSLWCVGFHKQMALGGILAWYGNLLGKLPEFIAKPLGACLECMASVHSLVWWVILFEPSPLMIMAIPIVSVLNVLINAKLDE